MFRFVKCETGNVAVIFAIALVPVIMAFGVVIDYGRQMNAAAKIQNAVDAAALALSKLPTTTTQSVLNTKAQQYFSANFNDSEVTLGALTVTPGDSTLSLSVTGTLATRVMTIANLTTMPLAANATVKWGSSKLEVALALDNTLSMSWSNKMDKLKEAARDLLTKLQNAAKNPGDVKVSLVPFNTMVKIGTSYKTESWMRWNLEEDKTKKTSGTWAGCVIDRDKTGDYDVTDAAPNTSVPGSLFTPAKTTQPNGSSCNDLAQMMPLNYDWTTLTSRVNAMTPTGYTNVTIGLMWAWHSLSTAAPLTEGGVSTEEVPIDKVIVLLTDGDNTEYRFCDNGPSWPQNSNDCSKNSTRSKIDARTALACANVKATGITLYTIRVIEGDEALLQTCASDTKKYFNVTNASDLPVVFNTIAGDLINLHLSK
jgi:Flp pilus assembly protein TadG